jgi:hypothetical protein
MSITIELSADLQFQLEQQAAQHGQDAGEFARQVLEERLTAPKAQPGARAIGSGLARRPPSELAALARAQGVEPVRRAEDLTGDFWPHDESVDDFLAARRSWKTEGAPEFPWSDSAESDTSAVME